MSRFVLIGPTYPYRGGIAHYTTLLAEALRQEHETLLISFSQQYPAWLFPGRDDRDPSTRPLRTEAEYLLNPLNPLSWRRTLQRIRHWQPDVVVMQWWHPFWAPAWSVLGRGIHRLSNQPRLLFVCHNILPHEQGWLSRMVLPRLLPWTLAPADGFVVHSQSDGAALRRYLPRAQVRVSSLPTYAALGNRSEMRLPVQLPDDRPLLLFCGFVRPYKGLDVLLDALPLVLTKLPLHLLIAGEFWQGEAAYREQIQRLGLQAHVTVWNQYLPDEMLSACIRRADVVVLPYRSATQSAIVQIAFGHGRPVITTDVGGLAEAVEDSHTGLVVSPEDPHALATAILRFFNEELKPVFMANIKRNNEQFSWQRLVNQIEELQQYTSSDELN